MVLKISPMIGSNQSIMDTGIVRTAPAHMVGVIKNFNALRTTVAMVNPLSPMKAAMVAMTNASHVMKNPTNGTKNEMIVRIKATSPMADDDFMTFSPFNRE